MAPEGRRESWETLITDQSGAAGVELAKVEIIANFFRVLD
jgi:hypothetical protein